jgi:hypothetical protein
MEEIFHKDCKPYNNQCYSILKLTHKEESFQFTKWHKNQYIVDYVL